MGNDDDYGFWDSVDDILESYEQEDAEQYDQRLQDECMPETGGWHMGDNPADHPWNRDMPGDISMCGIIILVVVFSLVAMCS